MVYDSMQRCSYRTKIRHIHGLPHASRNIQGMASVEGAGFGSWIANKARSVVSHVKRFFANNSSAIINGYKKIAPTIAGVANAITTAKEIVDKAKSNLPPGKAKELAEKFGTAADSINEKVKKAEEFVKKVDDHKATKKVLTGLSGLANGDELNVDNLKRYMKAGDPVDASNVDSSAGRLTLETKKVTKGRKKSSEKLSTSDMLAMINRHKSKVK